jgi:PAS domain S-box-containing protein
MAWVLMLTISEIIESPKFPKLLGSMPIGMCVVDVNLQYIEVNSAWAEILGYDPAELGNQSFSQATYPPDRLEDDALTVFMSGSAQQTFTTNKRWVRKDGSVVRGVMTVFPLTEPGQERHGFVTMVPDRNQVVDELQKEKAVHDLRSLLHAIRLASDAIGDSPENKPLSEAIANSVTLADLVATSLLNVEHDTQEACCARNVVESCISIVSATLPVNVNLRCHCSGETMVAIDEAELGKVVINLLTNARAALRDGGDIDVYCKDQDGFVLINVSDNGVGMSGSEVEEATRAFYTTKKDLDAGLGLSIVGSIIANANGRLAITSEKGMGSKVVCEIPQIAEHRPLAPAKFGADHFRSSREPIPSSRY